jgi:coupling of ubiquitin conjugation to ER degradation protein 1
MSTSTEANSTTLNIPQLALLLLVGFLAVRWILSSNNSPSTSSAQQRGGAASRGAGPRINPRHVDTIAAMFPQLSRREIMWDLQRNGGNVQMTTERVLSGQGLETVCYILFQSIVFVLRVF